MAPRIGFGAALQRSSDGTAGGIFTTVGDIYDLVPMGLQRDSVETTRHQSPERWREFLPGLKDGGEFSIDLVFDPADASVTSFLTDLNTDTVGYYKLIFSNTGATEWGCSAFVTGFEPAEPIDDKTMATVTFKVTGKPGFIT